MTSAEAKNLKVIFEAMQQHDANCGSPLIEIRMAPFEVQRLDWSEIRGVPVVEDTTLGTGRFRLVCSGQHDDGAPAEVEAVSNQELVTAGATTNERDAS